MWVASRHLPNLDGVNIITSRMRCYNALPLPFLLGPSSLNSTEHCSGKPCARRSFFWCPCVPYICTPHILPHVNSFGFSSPTAPLIPAERRYARAFGLPYAAQDEGSGGRLDINHHMMSLQWLEMMYYISRQGCFGWIGDCTAMV